MMDKLSAGGRVDWEALDEYNEKVKHHCFFSY